MLDEQGATGDATADRRVAPSAPRRGVAGSVGPRVTPTPAVPDAHTTSPPLTLGDAADLDRAFAAHAATLQRSLSRLVGDPETVDDLVQETFLRAWRQRGSHDPERSPLRAWLLLLARGAAVDHLRAQRVRPWHGLLRRPHAEPCAADAADPADQVLASWIVEEEVRRLPLGLRQVVVETQLRDRPHADVAADLGIPVGTVRSRLFHAMRAMRASLEDQGYAP